MQRNRSAHNAWFVIAIWGVIAIGSWKFSLLVFATDWTVLFNAETGGFRLGGWSLLPVTDDIIFAVFSDPVLTPPETEGARAQFPNRG